MKKTVKQAAQWANCHPSTIQRLLKTGTLKGERNGPKGRWKVTATKEEIQAVMAEHAPGAGWHKTTPAKNGGLVSFSLPAKPSLPKSQGLAEVFEWMRLEPSTRETLIALAKKFTDEELGFLLKL